MFDFKKSKLKKIDYRKNLMIFFSNTMVGFRFFLIGFLPIFFETFHRKKNVVGVDFLDTVSNRKKHSFRLAVFSE